MVRTRMLEEGEEGLGSEENEPPIIIDAEVKVLSIIPAHSNQLTYEPYLLLSVASLRRAGPVCL